MTQRVSTRPGERTRRGPFRLPRRSPAVLLYSLPLWALAALLASCGGEGAGPQGRAKRAESAEKVVVGVVWPWQARSELLFSDGIDMAVEEVTASGGIGGLPLEIRREDDNESVNDGRLVAQSLANDPDVMAVIGHLQSHVTVPAAAIYELGGVLLFAPAATSPELTRKDYRLVFRGTFDDAATGTQLAEYALANGWKRIGIYYVRSIYGRTLSNAFEERLSLDLDAQVMARDSYDPVQRVRAEMLEQVLLRWQQLDLDAIFLASEVPAAGGIIKAIRESGLDVPIFGGDAMSSPALIQAGGEAVEGTVVSCFFHPEDPRPAVRAFVEAFEARHGKPPDVGAALGYDSVKVLAHAMREAGTPAPEAVAETLRTMEPYEGVAGKFAFEDDGSLTKRELCLVRVENGEFHFLPQAAGAEGSSG